MKTTKPLQRTAELKRGCGLRFFADEIAARLALAGSGQQDSATRHENSTGKQARKCPYCPGWHLFPVGDGPRRKAASRTAGPPAAPRRAARDTGFPPAVRGACRSRAKGCCEGCGTWVGDGGEIQHRVARGRGGTRRAVISTVVNALLLCPPCHGTAESRDAHSHEAGMWLRNHQDPATEPILLHGAGGGGIRVWLTAGGGYTTGAPEGSGAA